MMSTINEVINTWKYKTLSVFMDGGSLSLFFLTPSGETKQISLGQNVFTEYYEEFGQVPARIYIDGQIVEKRSKTERILIEYLETNLINLLSKDEAKLLAPKIKFYKSEEYFNFKPVKLELSAKRKKYLELTAIILKYDLNPIEHKFLALKKQQLILSEFEKWVYDNETLIQHHYSSLVFDNLIILDYTKNHAKSELAKILEIDFRKLELHQLCQHLDQLIHPRNLTIEHIQHDSESSLYDPYFRYYFQFILNKIPIGMNNPFQLNAMDYSIDDSKRAAEFAEKFTNPNVFFEHILTNLESSSVRIVVEEELKEVDPNNYTEAYCGSKEDIIIQIDDQRILVNKDFITTKMKDYWL